MISDTTRMELLSSEECKRIKGTVSIFRALGIVASVLLVIYEIIVFNVEKKHDVVNMYGYLFPFFMLVFVYFILSRRYIFFPADLKANKKIVSDTTVLRKKKHGWFDMDARGGLSNV